MGAGSVRQILQHLARSPRRHRDRLVKGNEALQGFLVDPVQLVPRSIAFASWESYVVGSSIANRKMRCFANRVYDREVLCDEV